MPLQDSLQEKFSDYLSRPEFREQYASRPGAHADLNVKINSVDASGVQMSFMPTISIAASKHTGFCDPGPVTTLMDSAMGLSVMLSLEEFSSIATLELRTDWITNPVVNEEILVNAQVECNTEGLVFVHARAWQQNQAMPFCRGTGRFMLTQGEGNLARVIMETARAQEFPDERGDQ